MQAPLLWFAVILNDLSTCLECCWEVPVPLLAGMQKMQLKISGDMLSAYIYLSPALLYTKTALHSVTSHIPPEKAKERRPVTYRAVSLQLHSGLVADPQQNQQKPQQLVLQDLTGAATESPSCSGLSRMHRLTDCASLRRERCSSSSSYICTQSTSPQASKASVFLVQSAAL